MATSSPRGNKCNNTRSLFCPAQSLAGLVLCLAAATTQAMVPLEDSELSDVKGAGLAIAFDDFSLRFAPTSFIELTGQEPTGAAGAAGWRRGDVRYYGFSITGGSGAGGSAEWYGSCTNSFDADLCALGGGATGFAPVDNPYVLRAFQIPGYNPGGSFLTGGAQPTNLELVGPTSSDPWRWSFWGEIEVDRNNAFGAGAGLLQSQTIINGSNHTIDGKPSILRIFETTNGRFGLTYQSALSGDFRFSLAQESNSPDLLHEVPNFHDSAGLYFRNVDAFFPLGRLHSQAIVLDSTPANDGNFVIELTPVPSAPPAYNDIYCGAATCNVITSTEAFDAFGRTVQVIQSPNPETHGYTRWGNIAGPYNSTNGITFRPLDNAGAALPDQYLGAAEIDGVLIQQLKMTTLGI